MSDLNKVMQQAQKLQAGMEKVQSKLNSLEVIGESGGGVVKVCMTGNRDVKWVKISPEIRDDEKSILEELIAAAFNDAKRRAEKLAKSEMSDVARMFGLSDNMPFSTGGTTDNV